MNDLHVLKFNSYQDYQTRHENAKQLFLLAQKETDLLLQNYQHGDKIILPGFCAVCQTTSFFTVDRSHWSNCNGKWIPNWRESLYCKCGLISRVRAAFHLLLQESKLPTTAKIYLTEQVTPFYYQFKQRFPNLIGSEYLGNGLPSGFVREDGIRNESITQLSFAGNELDAVVSLEVFEHVPDYKKALAEAYRALKDSGVLLFSAPFRHDLERNLIRAVVNSDGSITHLMTPEYHGDPISQEGCLCFQHFGWQILDELREVGFEEVITLNYCSKNYGYLDFGQGLFFARKKPSHKNSSSQVPILQQSRNFKEQEKSTKAIDCYQNAIKGLEAELFSACYSLGELLEQQKQFSEALIYYQRAVSIHPDLGWLHYRVGQVLAQQNHLDEAIDSHQKAIEADPSTAWFYPTLGSLLEQQGKIREAIVCYQKAIELDDCLSWVHHQLGKALQQQGDIEGATRAYQKAIELEPELPWAYHSFGDFLTQLGEFDKAISCYQSALAIDPTLAWTHNALGNIYLWQKDTEKAIIAFRQSIKFDPNLYQTYSSLAELLSGVGEIEEAINSYKQAIYCKTKQSHPEFVEQFWDSSNPRKPNFIIIGAGKSGTSSLYTYLAQHPQVIPPVGKSDKEIDFFTVEFSKGIDWYLSHFPPIPEGSGFLTGESSPSYLQCADNAEKRLFASFPQVKLICLLRNPIDRAFSEYQQSVRIGIEKRSFEQVLEEELSILRMVDSSAKSCEAYWSTQEGYIGNSVYVFFLKKWLSTFPDNQLLVLQSEVFYSNPAKIMERVFKFLNLPDYQLSSYPIVNSGSYSSIEPKARGILHQFFKPYNQELEALLNEKFDWF
ncbi:MAG TPA: tetratricopeptide repeat protein [Trichocoleus sp.]|jgi:tetratricopeptide (TPR) repeat protein